MYVIEGLTAWTCRRQHRDPQVHHAAIDVENGNELTRLLHDLMTCVVRPPTPTPPWFPEDLPGDLMLLWRAGFNLLTWPMRSRWKRLERALGPPPRPSRASTVAHAPPVFR